MARSRIFVAGVVAGVSLAFLAACNVVLGLGDYEKVDADGGAADAATEADVVFVPDAPIDAPIDVEAGSYDPGRAWAKWKMPNPLNDAGYPNPMTYDAGGDSGAVFDNVTKLEWESVGTRTATAANVTEAHQYCATLAATNFAAVNDWRLPTRIELVTLLDYTRTTGATIDPVFTNAPADSFWSASPSGEPTPTNTWRVDFSTAEVRPLPPSSARVRCVSSRYAK